MTDALNDPVMIPNYFVGANIKELVFCNLYMEPLWTFDWCSSIWQAGDCLLFRALIFGSSFDISTSSMAGRQFLSAAGLKWQKDIAEIYSGLAQLY